jgi:ferredoxin-type protein NapF
MSSEINHSRRGFLRGKVRSAPAPLRPPWALPEAEFLARCTRCRNCAVICPTHIVQIREGYPEIDFRAGACTFCGECVRVCAPAALVREDGLRPWPALVRIGETCLATRGVECRICGEHCDESAIRFPPRLGGVPVPVVEADRCTGCGACVAPCPATAIKVR